MNQSFVIFAFYLQFDFYDFYDFLYINNFTALFYTKASADCLTLFEISNLVISFISQLLNCLGDGTCIFRFEVGLVLAPIFEE